MTKASLAPFASIGQGAVGAVTGLGRFGRFALAAARALPETAVWGPLVFVQMARLGVDSLPIALFIASFTGIVLALQASYTLTGAIPLYFVGVLVEKTMILELGPVLTGLALAGRVGANIAAELGTMRVTEQIDALETLAYDPIAYLVVPRVLAGRRHVPGRRRLRERGRRAAGWAAAMHLLDLSTPGVRPRARLFFDPFDVQFSLIKATSFGFVVTLVGCYNGFAATGGAAAVGRSTTQAVVAGSMLILVLDAFWAAALL